MEFLVLEVAHRLPSPLKRNQCWPEEVKSWVAYTPWGPFPPGRPWCLFLNSDQGSSFRFVRQSSLPRPFPSLPLASRDWPLSFINLHQPTSWKLWRILPLTPGSQQGRWKPWCSCYWLVQGSGGQHYWQDRARLPLRGSCSCTGTYWIGADEKAICVHKILFRPSKSGLKRVLLPGAVWPSMVQKQRKTLFFDQRMERCEHGLWSIQS